MKITKTADEGTSETRNTLLCASTGDQPLHDNDVFNHLTTEKNVVLKPLHKIDPQKRTPQMNYFRKDFEKTYYRLIHKHRCPHELIFWSRSQRT